MSATTGLGLVVHTVTLLNTDANLNNTRQRAKRLLFRKAERTGREEKEKLRDFS